MKVWTSLLMIMLFGWVILPATPSAEPADMETALDLMAANEHAAAALVLKDLLRDAPEDSELWYFLGRAYNRMNRFERASEALVRAGIYGFEGPDFEREMGISLFGRGYDRKALLSLRRARAKDPEAAYFRGMAASRLGNEDEAARAFDVAAADPAFEDRVDRFRSAASRRRATERPWSVTFNLGLDYNDNVTLSPDVTPFPGGAEPEGDFLYNLTATGAYTLLRSRNTEIGVRGFVNGFFPQKIENFDSVTYRGALFWRRSIQPFRLRLVAGHTGTNFDWDHYAASWDVQPGVTFVEADWAWTDLDYVLKRTSFNPEPANPLEDRDGFYQVLSLKQHFAFRSLLLEKQKTSFTLAVNVPWRNADGAAYDGDGVGLAFLFGQTLPRGFFLEADVAVDSMSYDHPHPRSTAGENREDDTVSAGFRASWNLKSDWMLYTGYRYTKNDSNIPDYFEFEQNIYSLGVIKRF